MKRTRPLHPCVRASRMHYHEAFRPVEFMHRPAEREYGVHCLHCHEPMVYHQPMDFWECPKCVLRVVPGAVTGSW